MSKKLVAVVTALVAGLGLTLAFAAGADAAKQAATDVPTSITACVNTKTGAVKVLTAKQAKKKCAKGSTKATWGTAGPAGAGGKNGTNGTNGTNGANGKNGVNGTNGVNGVDGTNGLHVYDATGRDLGALVGTVAPLGLPAEQVLGSDGGIYSFYDFGQLVPVSQFPVLFRDAGCNGTAYVDSGTNALFAWLFAGTSFRIVSRQLNLPTGPVATLAGLFGPARVWKATATSTPVPSPVPDYYTLAADGTTCVPDSTPPDDGDQLVALASVPAPADGVGPLTIR
jgi:hypothetical protein